LQIFEYYSASTWNKRKKLNPIPHTLFIICHFYIYIFTKDVDTKVKHTFLCLQS